MRLPKPLTLTTSTFFYVGYLPFIPGTFASLAGVGLFYLIKGNPCLYVLIAAILIIAGFLTAGEAEKILNKKDASCIVIDEVSGMLIGLALLPYYNTVIIIIAFILFRLLDTLKPFPAARLEKMRGSAGVMYDDIVAAVYTNIILQVALRIASLRAS